MNVTISYENLSEEIHRSNSYKGQYDIAFGVSQLPKFAAIKELGGKQ